MTRLADATSPDTTGAGLVLVPVGSIEQHGPHLPLDTDTTIAIAVAGLGSELKATNVGTNLGTSDAPRPPEAWTAGTSDAITRSCGNPILPGD